MMQGVLFLLLFFQTLLSPLAQHPELKRRKAHTHRMESSLYVKITYLDVMASSFQTEWATHEKIQQSLPEYFNCLKQMFSFLKNTTLVQIG